MVPRVRLSLVSAVAMTAFVAAVAVAQRRDAFVLSRDHPAIRYTAGDLDNPLVRLNERLAKGEVRLTYDAGHGYLTSLLDALSIPVSSQMLVFSKTSFQADLITMHNPRAVFFGDTVFVGWVRGADVLEIATADRRQGSVFYTLTQKAPGESDGPGEFDVAGVVGAVGLEQAAISTTSDAMASRRMRRTSSPWAAAGALSRRPCGFARA